MKKAAFLLVLFLGIILLVSGQTRGPIDLILVLDTSSSMSGSYREVSDYICGPFLKEFLRIGDTFHLISFSGSPRSEISRRIEGIGDVETVISRLLLLLPLDPYTDIAGALDYTERYIGRLPSARPRKAVFVTDGDQNPEPGTSAAILDSGALETRINETAARLRRNGTDFHLVRFPVTGGDSSAEAAPPAAVPPVAAPQPPTQPAERLPVSKGFNYVLLFVILGAAVLVILALIFFFMARKLRTSPNRAMAYAADQRKAETVPVVPVIPSEKAPPTGSLLLSLVVDDQNTNIGRRNIHSLKAGDVYTIGGGRLDDYLIFLVPLPAHIGEVLFDGTECTFVPKKPQYFPEIGSQPVPDCIGKIIRVVSDKRYELTFHLERYEDSLDSLNRLLNSAVLPSKPPEKEEKS